MTSFSYAYIFFQSNLLEIPIFCLFYHSLILRKGGGLFNVSAIISLSNLMTHPIVFFVIMSLPFSYIANILIAEIFAITAEAFLHKWVFGFNGLKCFLASSVSNLFSWQVAPILTFLIFY